MYIRLMSNAKLCTPKSTDEDACEAGECKLVLTGTDCKKKIFDYIAVSLDRRRNEKRMLRSDSGGATGDALLPAGFHCRPVEFSHCTA
ncbi:hypothetical protein EVAR_84114_1 [Eumeta japonica]|uniref:Uncharacterized protein n=1 Tax=Eumeta variegata TaxID=151549 RepID=A0A4C1UYX8_EUMVA|nr:hypothetical protein EVAR_84114_1 [Eumeta japonica]